MRVGGGKSLARSPSHTEAALHWEGGKRCGGGLPRGCVGGFEAGGAEVNGGWAREPPIERRALNRGGTEGRGRGQRMTGRWIRWIWGQSHSTMLEIQVHAR